MDPEEFRMIALSFPEAVESAHMRHPDFRVGGKIFATLGYPDAGSAMVKLTREEQDLLVAAAPNVFAPISGVWGRHGSTHVRLAAADEATIRDALARAWRKTAPRALVARAESRLLW